MRIILKTAYNAREKILKITKISEMRQFPDFSGTQQLRKCFKMG